MYMSNEKSESVVSEKDSLVNVGGDISDKKERIWSDCLKIIKGRVNSQSYKAWFEPIVPLRLEGKKFFIEVPSQFFYEWVEEHYYSLLTEALTQVTRTEIEIGYSINAEERDVVEEWLDPQAEQKLPVNKPASPANTAYGSSGIKSKPGFSFGPKTTLEPSINPRYTFENYIKGESNQFARAAALAVANNPGGTSFNPLVIYGGVGLGKTHLVHAIGNSLLHSGKSKRIL